MKAPGCQASVHISEKTATFKDTEGVNRRVPLKQNILNHLQTCKNVFSILSQGAADYFVTWSSRQYLSRSHFNSMGQITDFAVVCPVFNS